MKMNKRLTTISAVVLASSALALGTVASSVSTVSAQDNTETFVDFYGKTWTKYVTVNGKQYLRDTMDPESYLDEESRSIPLPEFINKPIRNPKNYDLVLKAVDGNTLKFKPGYKVEFFANGTEGRVIGPDGTVIFDTSLHDYSEMSRVKSQYVAELKYVANEIQTTPTTPTVAVSSASSDATNGAAAGTGTPASPSGTGAAAAQAGKANGKKDASSTAKPATKSVAAAATAKADKALPKTSAVK
ncbi:LPKTxAVK-anchored surface protein [Streptococcus pluranimalium]|uniref:LPKTxAVK-anchored surface protein n=1 Tax=Streptococcus pluranimalium TaxID=82348 RepID=UPI0039FBA936